LNPSSCTVCSESVLQPTTASQVAEVAVGSQQTIQPVVPAPAIVDKLTMLRSAIPPPVAVVRQPPILQPAIQLTAAVVNQLSMIQLQFSTHPAPISQFAIPPSSIIRLFNTFNS